MTKEERVKKEERRLTRFLKGVDPTKKKVAEGLIQRAAHLRITLDDLAADLDVNGYTEMFQQGKDNPPYSRKRPSADLYTTMNALYQKIIKQLTDLLPKESQTTQAKQSEQSLFEEYVIGRSE